MAYNYKSPYEIRLNSLQLAKHTLTDQYIAECAKYQTEQEGATDVVVTKAPTVDEIIEAAEKFNEFISKNSSEKS